MALFKSILSLTIISSFLALSFFSYNSIEFLKGFILFTFLQIIIYQLYVKIKIGFYDYLNIKKMEQFEKQGMTVKCPCYMEKTAFIPISVNGVNDYKCLDCHKNISVNLEAKTFLATEPLDGEAADAALLKVVEMLRKEEK